MDITFICRNVSSNSYPSMGASSYPGSTMKKKSYSASLEIDTKDPNNKGLSGSLYINSDTQLFELDQKYTICTDDTDDDDA